MQTFIDWMETNFAPKMNVINRNIWILTLKDSIMQILPMIFVGSLVTIISILQDFIPGFPDLWSLSSYSMGLISLFVAFLIPFNFMERKKLSEMRIVAGMAGIALYAVVIRMENVQELDFGVFGAGGMFVAIIVGIIAALVMALFGGFSFFKADSAIPDFVRSWFDSMLPIFIIILIGYLVVYVLNFDLYTFIINLFMPLGNFAESLPGFVFLYFIMVFFYSMGISVWVFTPIIYPIMFTGIQANIDAVAAGGIAANIMTQEVFYSGWLAIGGVGCTLTLVIMTALSKSRRLKALGRASIVPSILNINEPIIFGCIAWNPVMMIPMWIQGLVIPTITYIVLKAGLVNIPSQVFGMWYCPFPISTWLVSRDIMGIVLLAILIVVSALIWYPFFKLYERQQLVLEASMEED